MIELVKLEGQWRATMVLPREYAGLPGVFGGATVEGPWVRGVGQDPFYAIRELERALGAVFLELLAKRADPA